jgi:hypothetical protein
MPVKPGDERSGYSASPIGREGISTRTLETSLFFVPVVAIVAPVAACPKKMECSNRRLLAVCPLTLSRGRL